MVNDDRRGRAVKQVRALLFLILLGTIAVRAETAFPLDKGFRAISINGQDLIPARPRTTDGTPTSSTTRFDRIDRVLNLVVKRDAKHEGFVAYGRVACNFWNGRVVFDDGDRITFERVFQTAVACGEKPEQLFTPVGMMRWRMEGDILILQGEGSVFRFRAAH